MTTKNSYYKERGFTKNDLERMIDKFNPDEIITMFCEICSEKAEHIRTNYNDENLALAWEQLEKRLSDAHNAATRTTS